MCNLIPERKESENEVNNKTLEVIMSVNFPKLVADTKPWIHRAQRTPKKVSTPQNYTQAYIQTVGNQRQGENLERRQKEGKTLCIEEQGLELQQSFYQKP